MKSSCVTIQMKAIEQYFHVVLFVMLYKVVLTSKSMNKTLVCDHSNESYRAALSCDTVHYFSKVVPNFKSVNESLLCDHSNQS